VRRRRIADMVALGGRTVGLPATAASRAIEVSSCAKERNLSIADCSSSGPAMNSSNSTDSRVPVSVARRGRIRSYEAPMIARETPPASVARAPCASEAAVAHAGSGQLT
jgi:hypothetical protein